MESYTNSETDEEEMVDEGKSQQGQQQQAEQEEEVREEKYESLNAPAKTDEEVRERERNAYLNKCIVGAKVNLDGLDESGDGGDDEEEPPFVYRLHGESPRSSQDSVEVAERQVKC